VPDVPIFLDHSQSAHDKTFVFRRAQSARLLITRYTEAARRHMECVYLVPARVSGT